MPAVLYASMNFTKYWAYELKNCFRMEPPNSESPVFIQAGGLHGVEKK